MKYLNYILIAFGAFLALYATQGTGQNEYILIGGIAMLMMGIYRISKTLPSKHDEENDKDNNVNNQE